MAKFVVHSHGRLQAERYHALVDVRAFGPGERVVFEPYTKEVFEQTHTWMEEWKIFPEEQSGSAGYEESMFTAAPQR